MRVGSLLYDCVNGLGVLGKAFVEHAVITDVLAVRHPRHTSQGWYPSSPQTVLRPFDYQLAERFCLSCDVMLFFETPFNWSLIEACRRNGVKTALMPMHECYPENDVPLPDLFLCPSLADLRLAFDVCDGRYPNEDKCKFIPVPVETPWRLRTEARTFVHNAGNGSVKDRNGTDLLFEALKYVESRCKFVIRSQSPPGRYDSQMLALTRRNLPHGVDVALQHGTLPAERLYEQGGDVFVFCERWNGLCLPLQEARAAGMYCIAGDRFPINTWLPKDGLVPVSGYNRERAFRGFREVDSAFYDPRALAAKIDAVYGTDIAAYSETGRKWAEDNSWEVLGPQYKKLLEDLRGSEVH